VPEPPDGSSYEGELQDSTFSGSGTFKWANGDQYEGQWKVSKRHGKGTYLCMDPDAASLRLAAIGEGERADSSKYNGDWVDDLMNGRGEIEYYNASLDGFLKESEEEGEKSHGIEYTNRVVRRFVGDFKKGFPVAGSLETDACWHSSHCLGVPRASRKREYFERVIFDGNTHAGGFAVWYWVANADDESRGSCLIDIDANCEEYRAVVTQFAKSMPTLTLMISSIQRVQNHNLRLIFDLQRRALEKKVEAPPRSRPWNPSTMERWAFHAPVRMSVSV